MSGGVPKRIQISRTQRNTYCKAGGKDKVQGLVLCSGRRSQRAMCNYVMKRTNIPFSRVDIKGGQISRDGEDIIHTFATPGTYIFSIDIIGSDYVGYELEFDTLVVGAGGGGGGANADARDDVGASPIPSAAAGGGGAGGLVLDTSGKIIIQGGMKYQVIVGAGGAGGVSTPAFGGAALQGDTGENSSFFGNLAAGAVGGQPGNSGAHDQFGQGGPYPGDGGDHSSIDFRYGGGGGGAGFGQVGGDASFNALNVPPDASGGQGGFDPVSGTSSITGTSTTYGGGGGGGVVWFNQSTHTADIGAGGGVGGQGGYYLTNPIAAPDNSFNPVGYNVDFAGVSHYGYQPSAPPIGSVADLSLNILGTDYTIASMLFNDDLNSFSLCLENDPHSLPGNSFDSISFVSNVPGSEAHTYFTANASFSEPPLQVCWTWPAGYFPADLTYWSDASGTNLDIFINIGADPAGPPDRQGPLEAGIGGGGGGATSSDIRNSDGDAATYPQLPTAGGNGGDGIVIIRYKDPNNKKKRCADGLTI